MPTDWKEEVDFPKWASETGVYDVSDMQYMRSRANIEHQEKILQDKQIESELNRFRLSALTAQAKTDTVGLPVREKRQGKSTVNVKIKAKKRRLDHSSQDDVAGKDKETSVATSSAPQLSVEKKSKNHPQHSSTSVSTALGMLGDYNDSDSEREKN